VLETYPCTAAPH